MRQVYLLLVVCICTVSVGFGQQILTLEKAINTALQKNFDIQIAKNTVELNTVNNHIGVAGGLPTITGTITDQESVVNINQQLNTGTKIQRNGAASNNLNGNVTATMLLYNGYRVVTTKKRLEALQQLSEQQLNAQIQNTVATVMLRYFDVVRQTSYLKTTLQSIDVSKKRLEIIDTRKSVGLANDADVFQAQIDVNTRLQDYQAQELVLKQATVALLASMNVNTDSSVVIKDTIVVDRRVALDSVLKFVQQNPEVLAAKQQVVINELLEKETAALRQPSVRANLGTNYNRNQSTGGQLLLNQSYGPFVSVGVGLPLYNGGAFKRQQKTAAINTQTANLQKDRLLQDFSATIVRTYEAYKNNLQQIETQQLTFTLSQQLVNLTLQRFQLAQATIVEVREAQRSFEEAGYRLINLSYAAKLAEIELKRLSSKLQF